MWARHMELMLGLWLLISPFVFGHAEDAVFRWSHDLFVGTLLVVIPLAAHWRPLRMAHLGLVPVAVWLLGLGWWKTWHGASLHPDAAYQNWLLVGLLLAMFCIIPSDASAPPRPWRRQRDRVSR